MGLKKTLEFILNHPLNKTRKYDALQRFFKWQVSSRFLPWPIIYPITDKARIIVKKGMAGATGNLYCGLHDYEDMFFLLHFLRSEDLFLDIGANIGSYTVLASGHCQAQTIAFEPAPATYEFLMDNIRINRMESRVIAYNMALGGSEGSIPFTTSLDTINHVAVSGDASAIDVPIKRLDTMVGEKIPQLIKIDVEGYETEVLAGSGDLLDRYELKAIIIELNGAGSNYGFDESLIHQSLLSHGFLPYQYEPATRSLLRLEAFGNLNTIYIKDIDFVKNRLRSSPKIEILKQSI